MMIIFWVSSYFDIVLLWKHSFDSSGNCNYAKILIDYCLVMRFMRDFVTLLIDNFQSWLTIKLPLILVRTFKGLREPQIVVYNFFQGHPTQDCLWSTVRSFWAIFVKNWESGQKSLKIFKFWIEFGPQVGHSWFIPKIPKKYWFSAAEILPEDTVWYKL